MRIEIKSKEDLEKVIEYMHDSGFNNTDVQYGPTEKTFIIVSKEYEFKGKFIQRKTNEVKAICKLMLQNVKSYNIKFASKTDEKGYNTIGEDYFNTIETKDNEITLITSFQRIILEVDKVMGAFEKEEYFKTATPNY